MIVHRNGKNKMLELQTIALEVFVFQQEQIVVRTLDNNEGCLYQTKLTELSK